MQISFINWILQYQIDLIQSMLYNNRVLFVSVFFSHWRKKFNMYFQF